MYSHTQVGRYIRVRGHRPVTDCKFLGFLLTQRESHEIEVHIYIGQGTYPACIQWGFMYNMYKYGH